MAAMISMVLLCSCLAIAVTNGDETRSESDLRRALFQDYDKLVRPVKKTSDVVHVKVNLVPDAVRDVDIEKKMIKLDTWLHASWEDQYLTWDPAEYGGLKDLRIPANEVWKPDISLYSGTPDTALPEVMTNVVVSHNTTVTWVPPYTLKSHCRERSNNTDTNTFHCTIVLGSWTYDVTQLEMQEYVQDSLSQNDPEYFFNSHPKWILESMTASHENKPFACCTELYSEVLFDIHLRRRHAHSHNHHPHGHSHGHSHDE